MCYGLHVSTPTNYVNACTISQQASINLNNLSSQFRSTRLERLHRVAWESGKQMPGHIGQNLSAGELKYFETYCGLLDDFNAEYSEFTNLDLTVDLTPPKDLFIEVRIKKDLGSMVLPESGQVLLQKNTTHLLRRSEVDSLIKQGVADEVLQ